MTKAPTFYDINREDLSVLSDEISQACAMLAHTFEGASFVGFMRLSENELKNYLWATHARLVEASRRISRVLERNRFNSAVEAATFEDKAVGEEYSFTDLRLEEMRNRRGFNMLDRVLELAKEAAVNSDCSPYARDTFQVIQTFAGEARSALAYVEPTVRRFEVAGVVGERMHDCDKELERAVETLHWLAIETCDEDVAAALVRRAQNLVSASEALLAVMQKDGAGGIRRSQCGEASA